MQQPRTGRTKWFLYLSHDPCHISTLSSATTFQRSQGAMKVGDSSVLVILLAWLVPSTWWCFGVFLQTRHKHGKQGLNPTLPP